MRSVSAQSLQGVPTCYHRFESEIIQIKMSYPTNAHNKCLVTLNPWIRTNKGLVPQLTTKKKSWQWKGRTKTGLVLS
ncbi:hypothetical protein I7I53_12143 [Histoplasma capsulatum var. duboisii H88]|uniref:Uncharacterized protein n=1 Tax=Ajellomyces capsulatus (strain H88) TaxID=544711 RepID=A0A8A1LV97_AJEC8|nr:hypothetical protein I7I53_12143 [Histoplasma capsulatum var. duboisii H88]